MQPTCVTSSKDSKSEKSKYFFLNRHHLDIPKNSSESCTRAQFFFFFPTELTILSFEQKSDHSLFSIQWKKVHVYFNGWPCNYMCHVSICTGYLNVSSIINLHIAPSPVLLFIFVFCSYTHLNIYLKENSLYV